jgi:hypothetical protein
MYNQEVKGFVLFQLTQIIIFGYVKLIKSIIKCDIINLNMHLHYIFMIFFKDGKTYHISVVA